MGQRQRYRVARHPYCERRLLRGDLLRKWGVQWEGKQDRQWPRPEFINERSVDVGDVVPRGEERAELREGGDVHNEWVVLRAGFGEEDGLDGGGGEGVGAEAVDGFRGEGDGVGDAAGEESAGVGEAGEGGGVADV